MGRLTLEDWKTQLERNQEAELIDQRRELVSKTHGIDVCISDDANASEDGKRSVHPMLQYG